MGKAKQSTGDPLGAIADLTKAVALKDDFTDTYLVRARVLLWKTSRLLLPVLDLNSFNEEAALLLGALLIGQERRDEAIAFFDETIELKPDFAKIYFERGRAKNGKEDKEEAFADLKKLIELNPAGNEA